jgi:hypothetical protein
MRVHPDLVEIQRAFLAAFAPPPHVAVCNTADAIEALELARTSADPPLKDRTMRAVLLWLLETLERRQ